MTEAEYRGLVERVLSEGAYDRERGAYTLKDGRGVKATITHVDAGIVPGVVKLLKADLDAANARAVEADARLVVERTETNRYRDAWLHAIRERDEATRQFHEYLVAVGKAKRELS